MITTFHLPADELNLGILNAIKEAFKGKDIEIIVSDAGGQKNDIGDLLMRIDNLKNGKNVVTFNPDEFFRSYKKKVADASNQV